MGSEARAAARNGRKKSLDTAGPNSGGPKLKKVTGGTTGVADFFTPVSKRCKVAAEIAEHERIEGNLLHEAPKEGDDEDFQDPGNSKEEPKVPNSAPKEETNDDFQESSVLATIFKREPKKEKEKKEKIKIEAAASMAEVPSVPYPAVLAPVANKKSRKGKDKKEIDTVVPQPEEPDVSQPTVLAAIFDRKPEKKKYKKEKESETAAPQPEEPSMSQPACPTEQTLPVGSPASEKQFKPSPAKKKLRKQPSSGIESKPIVGVHGPDLRTQARQAAEENARMSAGKATHPFFARQKVGGAKTLAMDEVSQFSEGQNLLHAPDTPEETPGMSTLKAPHPFFARQKLGGSKAPAVDETLHNFETASLQPCPPLHVTQDVEVGEKNLAWDSRWTLSSVIGTAKSGEEEGAKWPFSSSPPLFTWTWPLQQGANKGSHPVSQKVALQQLVAYLKTPGGKASSSFFSAEDLQSEEDHVEKLVERLSSYYFSHAKGVHFEHNFVLQPSEEGQEKDANGSQNLLWTDQYQPQNSQEVCGNRDTVNFLRTWLQEWRERILLHRGVAKKTEESGDDDDDHDSDFEDSLTEDDNEDLQNCLLVTGPVGCGKSAAIYACATEQGFTVIEVNASDCRNGALIKHKFKEAMESHGLSNRSSGMVASDIQTASPEGKTNLVHPGKKANLCRRNIFQDEDSQTQLAFSQGSSRGYAPPPSLRRLRVILFEDVDTVFEEDSGFMGALALLARTSKCPIIFTSNNPEPVLPQVRQVQSIKFQQLSIKELVEHAYMICMAEGVACSPGLLEDIVKANGYDLRKLLMLLQFWSQGLPVDTHRLEGYSELPASLLSHTVSEEPVIAKQSQKTDLLHCLMQLDGCPQVPVGEVLGPNQKISISKCGSRHGLLVASSDQSAPGCSGKLTGKSLKIDVDGGEREEKEPKFERQLDTDWLFECDSQHRVLPCLFPANKPCLLTHSVFEHLKAVGQRADDSVDVVAATWSRYRIDDLQAKADAASQARKAAKKLQAAARKEAIAISSRLDNGTIDCPNVSLLDTLRSDGAVMNPLSAAGQSMDFPGNGAFLDPPPDGSLEEVGQLDLADIYSKMGETSRGDALISGPVDLLTVDLRANLTDLNRAADGVSQAMSQGRENLTLLPIRACETSGLDAPSVLLDFMDEQYIQYSSDRTGFNLSKTWLAEGTESCHSLSSGHPLYHDQDQQDLLKLATVDMNLQETATNFGQGEVDFSFTKLMESSYSSLAVQTAMQECNEYSLSLLQGHEHYSAHLSESSRAYMQGAYPPGPQLTIEQMNNQCGTHSLPEFGEGSSPILLSHFQTTPYEGPELVSKQNTQKQNLWVLNRNPHTNTADIEVEEQLMTRMFTDHADTTVRGTGTSLDGDTCTRPIGAMGYSPSSQEVEWTLHRRDLGPDFDSDMGFSVLNGPVSDFLQQTVNFSTELNDNSNLFPKFSSQNSCLAQQVRPPEPGAFASVHGKTFAKAEECLSTPLHTSKCILPDNTATPVKEGPISASLVAITNLRLHTMGSEIVKKGWEALRESEELPSISHDVGETVLLEGILCDLSACDILSSLSDAETQRSMRRRVGGQDTFCSSAHASKAVAALLAQMQLSQALVPPDTWPFLGCHVGPSVTQHEPSRLEMQARLDQSVEDILPQRCRILGALGKVEYNAFHSKLIRLESIKHDNKAGMTTRQQRFM